MALPCTSIVAFSKGKSTCNFRAKNDRPDYICPALATQSHGPESRKWFVATECGPIQNVRITIALDLKTLPSPPRTTSPTVPLRRHPYRWQPISAKPMVFRANHKPWPAVERRRTGTAMARELLWTFHRERL